MKNADIKVQGGRASGAAEALGSSSSASSPGTSTWAIWRNATSLQTKV
eukprot:CAMPEP_0180084340 /NCGR_PEP_ID=MMETSP0985-20121206/19801_1 /TAXON_ID=483367 /ORGANISM="non described non described, Strain CCMP 2436" /LENGTH=47 /DNA_ID= /DNA_START= /DNA_END= /DNA_ORIENTATION=